MPHVLLDTSVLLPATLSPGGMARKLWLLLALGALEHQIERHRLDIEALQAEAAASGAHAHVLQGSEVQARADEQVHGTLRELLPENAPAGWMALGSNALFDEYERKVREIGQRFSPSVRASDVMPLRRQVEAVCIAASPPFEIALAPQLTRDRKDDPIVYAALLGHADYLISDDRDVVSDGSEHVYEHDEHRTLAVTFNRFVTTYFEPADLDWGAIDGRWLRHAFDDPAAGTVWRSMSKRDGSG